MAKVYEDFDTLSAILIGLNNNCHTQRGKWEDDAVNWKFSRNIAYAKFRENKILAKWCNHSSVYWYRQIMPKSQILNVINMSFIAICEN